MGYNPASAILDDPRSGYAVKLQQSIITGMGTPVDAGTPRPRHRMQEDVGNVINPMIVDGMVHGGVTQSIGQALQEEAIYDDSGQLLTGSMMDYAVPAADVLPSFELDRTVTPSTANPLGIKWAGETGTIASSRAVVNAVIDALTPFAIKHIDMPLKPEGVWRAIQAARGLS